MRAGRLERLRRGFWPLPALGLVLGAGLGLGLPALEGLAGGAEGVFAFGGEPAAARDLLVAIATLTVSIIGLAFSVTLVALTLASQQLSPRVLRTFRADRLNQSTLAAFVGVAVYALLVLRSVRAGADSYVPGASTTLALAGTVAALGLFVAFVNNIVLSLQPATIIRRIAKDGRTALEATAAGEPVPEPPAPARGAPVRADRAGYVQGVDAGAAVAALAAADRSARLCPRTGDFVASGDVLAVLEGDAAPDEALAGRLRAAVTLGQERSLEQDAAFPIRQLADIALKALSPSLNDPTTAENALGSMGELLVRAAGRPLGPRAVRDGAGRVRLHVPGQELGALVRLGFDQVRGQVRDDPALAVTVLEMLARVRRAAPADGEAARQAALVVERFGGSGAVADDRERVRARHAELFGSAS